MLRAAKDCIPCQEKLARLRADARRRHELSKQQAKVEADAQGIEAPVFPEDIDRLFAHYGIDVTDVDSWDTPNDLVVFVTCKSGKKLVLKR